MEKVDGLNIHWRLNSNHQPVFARNISQIKSGGIPLDIIQDKMKSHPGGIQFLEGINAIAGRASRIVWPKFPNDAWINTEIVSSKHPQTIKYDHDCLVYHDIVVLSANGRRMVSCADAFQGKWKEFIDAEKHNPHSWRSYHQLPVKISSHPSVSKAMEKTLVDLKKLYRKYSLTEKSTVQEYYFQKTLHQCLDLEVPLTAAVQISENVWKQGRHKIREIKSGLPTNIHNEVDKIALSKYRQGYQGKCKVEMITLWDFFGASVVGKLGSNIIAHTDQARHRLDELIRFNVIQAKNIHNDTHPEIWESLQPYLARFNSLNVNCPVMEGIVIPWNGNKYKLTGAFPSMNRICGAVRYPLGIDFETSKEETFARVF